MWVYSLPWRPGRSGRAGPAFLLAGGARVGMELSENMVSDTLASCVGIWVCEFCGGESSEETKDRKEEGKKGGKKEGKEKVSFSGFVSEITVIHCLYSVEGLQISTCSFPTSVPV